MGRRLYNLIEPPGYLEWNLSSWMSLKEYYNGFCWEAWHHVFVRAVTQCNSFLGCHPYAARPWVVCRLFHYRFSSRCWIKPMFFQREDSQSGCVGSDWLNLSVNGVCLSTGIMSTISWDGIQWFIQASAEYSSVILGDLTRITSDNDFSCIHQEWKVVSVSFITPREKRQRGCHVWVR